MKTFEFVPAVCRDTPATETEKAIPAEYRGSVTLRRPTFDERFEFAENSGIDLDTMGEASENKSKIGTLRKLVKFSEAFYEKVEIERVADGMKFDSFEALSYDGDCGVILMEIAGVLFRGKVTKN